MSSPLENKTIRPGSLLNYSYYRSNRTPHTPARNMAQTNPVKKRSIFGKLVTVIVVIGLGFLLFRGAAALAGKISDETNNQSPATAVVTKNECAGNRLNKLIVVSINQRHLWACQQSRSVHDTPVITGLMHHPETETPLGTYKVYAKQTNTTLKGSDSRGSWSDPVYYWMPFLDNKYGTYGFHDATWRPETEFGKVSPTSEDASHGCVELPLADSEWLFNWSLVGTPVAVKS